MTKTTAHRTALITNGSVYGSTLGNELQRYCCSVVKA